MNSVRYVHIIFLLLLVGTFGCKSKKLISDLTPGSLTEKDYDQLRVEHNIDYQWYGSEAKIVVDMSGDRIPAKMYLRMENGKSIWMVIKKFGIEGARILITPDSVTVLNRQDKSYYKIALDKFKKLYHVDLEFEEIQDLMIGNILEHNDDDIIKREFLEKHYAVTYSIRDLLLKYWQDNNSGAMVHSKISDAKNRIILSEYGDYQLTNNLLKTPFFRSYSIPDTEQGALSLELKFNSIELDTPQNMPFEIPSHYVRID